MRRTADFNKANTVFNNMIAQKMDAAMDQERIATANKIFNDIEPEELEAEAEADEIEARRNRRNLRVRRNRRSGSRRSSSLN